jgi:putative colanic acid biosynthesis acetyltransferase WcaF
LIQLDQYKPSPDYSPGAPLWKQLLWYYLGDPLVRSYVFPFSSPKIALLRSFGATLGEGIRIKSGVKIKFPWQLTIGNHCWLGEDVWIDNPAPVIIEDHVCLSQGVYLCTGNHDWRKPSFDLRLAGICLKSGSWLAAKSIVAPGVTAGAGSILTLGSVATQSLDDWTIYCGNPAKALKRREIEPET